MRARCWKVVAGAIVVASLCLAGQARLLAQSPEQNISLPLPADSASWINSSPLSMASLEGKGALVYFFEETCPKCRAAWPDMMALAKKYEGQPVAFIAVNSGTARAALESYAKQCKVNWPIVVDTSRQLEQAAGVGEISLQNICQVRVITADGKVVPARWDDMEGAVKIALEGAKWQIDPATIPSQLRPAWQAIEFGNYGAAGPVIHKALSSKDSATQDAAAKLAAVVKPKLDAAVSEAKSSLSGGDKWLAFNQFNSIHPRFDGFDVPPEVDEQRKTLAADPQIRGAIQASKKVEMARKILAAGSNVSPVARHSVETLLKQAGKDGAGTDVANQAEKLMAQLDHPQAAAASQPAPAATAETPGQPAASASETAEQWIQRLEKDYAQAAGPESDSKYADEKSVFLKKYAKDPLRWRLKLLDASRALGATENREETLKKAQPGLVEAVAAKDASETLREQASVMNLRIDFMRSAPKDELMKDLAAHFKAFPKSSVNAGIAQAVLRSITGGMDEEHQIAALQEYKSNAMAPLAAAAATRITQLENLLELKKNPMELKFTAADGRSFDLAEQHGKIVLIDYWATWCGPCVAGLPEVIELYKKYHDQGFEIVGISFDQDKQSLEGFVKDRDMTWVQFFDGKGWENTYGVKYGISGIPTMWLVGKDGRVIDFNARSELAAKVEKLVGHDVAATSAGVK
jgi:thiol-disulfide isomerase/thioredoxin